MIIIVKKSNIIMIALIFLLVIAIFSLNVGGEDRAVTVAKDKDVQKTVLLDPGHGGEDPGAVSDYSGAKEKDINLAIALKVRKLLDDDGYKVLMTREEDKLEYDPSTTNIVQKRKQDLLRRKKMMDEAGADIVVSIHLNKFGQTQYYGAQTFYPPVQLKAKNLP
jgi:N-acetylmuramoyl-L-alanine amidase